eukprot:scaffold158271_cov14-Tisochrysis_lutea.AAC.1
MVRGHCEGNSARGKEAQQGNKVTQEERRHTKATQTTRQQGNAGGKEAHNKTKVPFLSRSTDPRPVVPNIMCYVPLSSGANMVEFEPSRSWSAKVPKMRGKS